MNNIAIFASGEGTNAEAIFDFFEANFSRGRVVTLITNKPDVGALRRAERHGIPTKVFPNKIFRDSPSEVLGYLEEMKVDFIVLAGFMILFPMDIVQKYEGRILNIHPALLPKFGGKGMYGHHVHEAVVANKEKFTGITIHLVNEHYDSGSIVFQAKVAVELCDTAEDVEAKVRVLELQHYAPVIASTIHSLKGTSKLI